MAVMRQSVSRESPVPVDVDVLPDLLAILVLGEGPVHDGVPWDVVAPVGVDEEGQPDVVYPGEEVEGVPGSLTGARPPAPPPST